MGILGALGDGMTLANGIDLVNAKEGDNWIFSEAEQLGGVRKNQGQVAAMIILNPANLEKVKGQVGNFGITESALAALEAQVGSTTPSEDSPATALYTAAVLAAAAVFAL